MIHASLSVRQLLNLFAEHARGLCSERYYFHDFE